MCEFLQLQAMLDSLFSDYSEHSVLSFLDCNALGEADVSLQYVVRRRRLLSISAVSDGDTRCARASKRRETGASSLVAAGSGNISSNVHWARCPAPRLISVLGLSGKVWDLSVHCASSRRLKATMDLRGTWKVKHRRGRCHIQSHSEAIPLPPFANNGTGTRNRETLLWVLAVTYIQSNASACRSPQGCSLRTL